MSRSNICYICGKSYPKMIKGKGGYICFDCIEKCHERLEVIQNSIATEDNRIQVESEKISFGASPIEMKKMMDEYVIGQDVFKERLVTAVYNHAKRIKAKKNGISNIEIEKSNILLVGPTGSGKSYTIKTLAKKLGIPLVIGDANTLSAAGYFLV